VVPPLAEPVTVNGLQLPQRLLELIAAGRWRCPSDVGSLRALTGLHDAADFLFMDVPSIRRNTDALIAEIARGDATLFGLTSSRQLAGPDVPGILDVDRAVLIAATYGDGMLCLDYREHPERPEVVVSVWSAGPTRWRALAADIAAFASLLGL